MYRVLLVDDEYMITEGLKVLIPFEKWNMQVVSTANDAETALAYIKDNPVDLVITDVNMPGMNGLQMIEQMKTSLPNAAFIILSGYQEFEYVKTALNLQVADYLVKPVDKVELAAILEKLKKEFDRSSNNQLELIFKEETSEDEIATYLKSFDSVWLGAAAQEKGLVSVLYNILGQTGYLFLSSQKEEALYLEEFTAPYKQGLQAFKLNLEKLYFMERLVCKKPIRSLATMSPCIV